LPASRLEFCLPVARKHTERCANPANFKIRKILILTIDCPSTLIPLPSTNSHKTTNFPGKRVFLPGMNWLKETLLLLRKEIVLEWRMKYALSGILLYVLSTVFIVYTAFVRLEPPVWNTVFWIIALFASVNAVVKSFVQENSTRQLYYYSLANPIAILLSKIIYNAGLLLLLNVLCWIGLGIVAGNPVRDAGQFVLALVLASVGFSITFTFISAIAAKADNSATLMAILSFPVVIPILLTLIKISANALRLLNDTNLDQDVWTLVGIDLLLLGLALVLYPFLWKD